MNLEPWRAENSRTRRARREREWRDYARLLVSDIRLYHEEEVLLGRMEKDLAARLHGPIARARARYLARCEDPRIFDGELVRILAGGDPGNVG